MRTWNAGSRVGTASERLPSGSSLHGSAGAGCCLYGPRSPNICPDTPSLRKNPVFLYYQDHFQKPMPFSPDIAVSIDDVIEQKYDMLDSHVSQVYEWLPWHSGTLDQVPSDAKQRRAWLKKQRIFAVDEVLRGALVARYGASRAKQIRFVEAFEICEYGRQPDEAEIRRLFPFLRGHSLKIEFLLPGLKEIQCSRRCKNSIFKL